MAKFKTMKMEAVRGLAVAGLRHYYAEYLRHCLRLRNEGWDLTDYIGHLVDVRKRLFQVDELSEICNYRIFVKGSGDTILFKPNKAQMEVYGVVRKQRQAGKPVRIIILKARQIGISTFVEAMIYRWTKCEAGTKGIVVAHEKDPAKHLFGMYELFYKSDPYPRAGLLGDEGIYYFDKHDTRDIRRFENEKRKMRDAGKESFIDAWAEHELEGGNVIVKSGYTPDSARSMTLHHAHLSEAAMYRDPQGTMSGVLQAVGEYPKTSVFIETTVKHGLGVQWFKKLWYSKKDGYARLFFPWFMTSEYSKRFDSRDEREIFENSMEEEEKDYMGRYRLSLEQMKWRREKIHGPDFGGNIFDFNQEYPASAELVFKSQGGSYFGAAVVDLMKP